MALDYGKKRTGIAVTDTLKISANGLTTVETPKLDEFLRDYMRRENVEVLVVGEPLRLNDEPSKIESEIGEFIKRFKKQFPEIRVEREDERFTSKMAVQTMVEGGVKKMKRRDKSLVDKVSATLILQSYLGNEL